MTTTTPTVDNQTPNVEEPIPTFNIRAEYCVSCRGGAKTMAAHVAYLPSTKSDLYFCEHHARESEKNLKEQGFVIIPTVRHHQ